MITLIISARATPSRPRAEAMTHLKSVHGPLVYNAPDDAGAMPSVYVQNHVLTDLQLPPALEAWRWDRDLVTEVSFAGIDDLKASTQTDYYLTKLKPDEGHFVDLSSVRPLIVRKPVVEGDTEEATYKLLIYLRRGTDAVAFETAWTDARRSVAGGCVAQSAGLAISAPGAPPAFVDGVWSLWFATRADVEAFVLTTLKQVMSRLSASLAKEPGFIVLAEEFGSARLRRENTLALEGAQ